MYIDFSPLFRKDLVFLFIPPRNKERTHMKKLGEIEQDIIQKKLTPVYFFYGEEAYFIDRLTDLLELHVVTEAEKSFNYDMLYGPDITATALIATARAYPVMAQRRLVIVKEAHRIRKDQIEKLVSYLEKPVPTTVLVLIHKSDSKPDGRTKFGKMITQNNAVITSFESKKLYENQVGNWVEDIIKRKGYGIQSDALQLIIASLGTNLTMIENELQKIFTHLSAEQKNVIDKNMVYDFINIDREYNVFELINSLGQKNVYNSHLIVHQLLSNTKSYAPLMILSQIYNFYAKLALLKQQRIESDSAAAQTLGISPFIARQYVSAVKNYSYERLCQNMHFIVEADLSLKGIRTTQMGEDHILKTLVYRLLQ